MPLYFRVTALLIAFPAVGWPNLIRNPSFEFETTDSPHEALHWKLDKPDTHGDSYGTASREGWRAHDGVFMMAIRGTWANEGTYGGCWQEVPGEPGITYRAAARFWADLSWSSQVQEIKLEFWNEDYTQLLDSKITPLGDIGERWVQREVVATAPELTAWARIVIYVNGVGDHGALHIDSVYLAPEDEPEGLPTNVMIEILDEPGETSDETEE